MMDAMLFIWLIGDWAVLIPLTEPIAVFIIVPGEAMPFIADPVCMPPILFILPIIVPIELMPIALMPAAVPLMLPIACMDWGE